MSLFIKLKLAYTYLKACKSYNGIYSTALFLKHVWLVVKTYYLIAFNPITSVTVKF